MEFDQLVLVSLASLILIFVLSLSCYLKLKPRKKQLLYHWLFVGALPTLLLNSHRLTEWLAEVFLSFDNGVGSFVVVGPIFSKLIYLVTCHPQNIEYILKTNFNNFPKGSDFKEIFSILGDGIFTADGESWKLQRKMIHAIFMSPEFRGVVSRVTQKLTEDDLVPYLANVAREDCVIDLQDICKRLAFDSTISVMIGEEERYLSRDFPRNEFAEAMDIAQEAVLYRHVMPKFCWKLLRLFSVGRERSLVNARKTIDLVIEKYTSQKKMEFLCHDDHENMGDVLSMIISKCSNDESLMKGEFLRDVMLNLFFAGKDTIASSLVWFFWMVAKTPDVEWKIVEELKSVVVKKNTEADGGMRANKSHWVFDLEDVKGLIYLHAALYEVLRLCPAVHLNSKSVTREDVLPDGSLVKPGMQIIIPYYSQGRMPWIWGADSTEFKPERWIDDEGKLSNKELSKFFAFSAGPRSCLGKDMSFRQLKVFVAAVLFNFHVEVVDGQEVCSKPAITLDMKNGLLVKIQERLI